MQWPKAATPRYASPFRSLSRKQRQRFELAFLELFDLCMETSDDAEERWAQAKLKALYLGAPLDDFAPSFFDAMRWAAEVRGAQRPPDPGS